MSKCIAINQLQPGMVILRVTQQNGPVKVKKSGLVTSQAMVQGLIEMGIQQVEIDPEQTVEVQSPHIAKSTTRKMFESDIAPNSRADDGLSEQFHRSLFLPSVQDIPSAWHFYTKRYGLAIFIGLGGLGLGWTLANYSQLVELVATPPEQRAPVELVQKTPQPSPTVPGPIEPTSEPQYLQSNNQGVPESLQPDEIAQQDNEVVPVVAEPMQPVDLSPAPTQTIEAPVPQVSADLLARFEQALTEVEDTPVTETNEPSSSEQAVPRIDQLPAWVMTRLPSMAFSAHMYASDDAERWVRVNGTRMVEGDLIDGTVEIVSIEPQHVILNYSGQEFSMAALTDW